jgi:DNA-binding LacI/PurR family transcriptional regulator
MRGPHVDGLIMMSSDTDDPILPLLIATNRRSSWSDATLPGRCHRDVSNRDARFRRSHLIELGHQRIATIPATLHGRGHGSPATATAGARRSGHPIRPV